MKKLSFLIVGIALFTAFYACQKDSLGIYKPKMKIDKVYSESNGHFLQEQWIWDGNQLSKIDFYRKNGNIDHTQKYVYDNQRLVRIESGDLHSEFYYDGKILSEIKTFSGDELLDSYAFSYEKGKISHLAVNQRSKSAEAGNLLCSFIPGYDYLIAEGSHYAEEKSFSYDFSSAEIEFFWVDGDVQHIRATLFSEGGVKHYVFTYIYDENNNPHYNFLSQSAGGQIVGESPVNLFFCKHNVRGINIADEDAPPYSGSTSRTFSYDYYKKFPTKVYSTNKLYSGGEDSSLIYTYVYAF